MREKAHLLKETILYIVFGVLTVAVNTICYDVLYNHMGVMNVYSTITAWAFAVFFSFITNRKFVFNSQSNSANVFLREFASFVSFRVATEVVDIVIMILAVDILHSNGVIWKVISNIIVAILNYIASKLVIFKK